jgi:hypothetical protein
MNEFQGQRLRDAREDDVKIGNFQVGAYWKVLDQDDKPKIVHHGGKLTEECWRVVVPLGEGYAIGNLDFHTVREHEDGTISVRPGDGSSNSILVSRGGTSWHGYIEHGVFSEA